MIRCIIMGLLGLLFSGCLPPNGGEHQKGVDYCKALKVSKKIGKELDRHNVELNGMYVGVTTTIFSKPVIHLSVYLSNPLKDYEFLFEEAEKEKKKLKLEEKVKIKVYKGDLKFKKLLKEKTLS